MTAWCTRILLVLVVVFAAASPAGTRLLMSVTAQQRDVYRALMPDFTVFEFGISEKARHLKLNALAISHRYLVLQGQAFPPGVGLRAETSARMALTYAVLVIVGSILLARGRAVRLALSGALAAALAASMLIGITPLVLAGQQWGTVVEPFSEPSVAAWLGGLSDVLLHGGGYGLAALCVVCVRLVANAPLAPSGGGGDSSPVQQRAQNAVTPSSTRKTLPNA